MLPGLMAVSSFWEDPGAWLKQTEDEGSILGGLVSRVEAAVNSLTVIDWVLLAVAAGLIAWVWASLRALTRLGPIEVAALEHDGKDADGVPLKALTAQLRESLSRTGLSPPPAVPAGTPQINLIDAIKESPAPNASWIAAIIQLLPRPRPSEYHIGGVLLGTEPEVDKKAAMRATVRAGGRQRGPCGLRFAVVPAGDGTSELKTVDGYAKHSDAVTAAASEMFLHISQDATGAFPIWTRWHDRRPLEAFVGSWKLREDGRIQEAIDKLEAAKRDEPFNALADLQVANLYEKCKPASGPADVGQVQLRAHAVRRYLEVADAFYEVVEARYRLAIAASTLASATNMELEVADVVGILRLEGANTVDALPRALRELADGERDAVLELLRPWWALAHFRLRTQFEPKGYERRAMRRAVRISRHCHSLHRLSELGIKRRRDRARIWVMARLRSALVRVVHLFFGFGTTGWQAHYNAACFDALRLELRETTSGISGPSASRLPRLRRRALRNLSIALGEAGDQLTLDWVLRRDRDLETLRTTMHTDATWAGLIEHPRAERRETQLEAKVPSRREGTVTVVTVPDHPWPRYLPILFWLVVTLGFVFLLDRADTNEAHEVFIRAAIAGTLVSLGFLAYSIYKGAIRARDARRRRRAVQASPGQ